ncbi:hypothetical protein AN619_16460 [Thermotalea metallivorans]|uniref:Uncharacterized protein n=1 Tax=Thermotalea metallivorans TaxID=520762 RepID=A0A140L525_9FIRM|nr:hypothetical protein AN619_16460 [Thermotalea metallivorans]
MRKLILFLCLFVLGFSMVYAMTNKYIMKDKQEMIPPGLTWDNTTEIIDCKNGSWTIETFPDKYWRPFDELQSEEVLNILENGEKVAEFGCPEAAKLNKNSKDLVIIRGQYLGGSGLMNLGAQAIFRGADDLKYYATYYLLDTDLERVLLYERLKPNMVVRIHAYVDPKPTDNLEIGRKVYNFYPVKFEIWEIKEDSE